MLWDSYTASQQRTSSDTTYTVSEVAERSGLELTVFCLDYLEGVSIHPGAQVRTTKQEASCYFLVFV